MPPSNFNGTSKDSLLPDAFAVPTAIPAFIGYTPQAIDEGKSLTNVPRKIGSLAEFTTLYGLPEGADATANSFFPSYYLVKQADKPDKGPFMEIDGGYYSILPDPDTLYFLYNSVRLFFENGGGEAYIVSVGSYGQPSFQPIHPGDPVVNKNVQLQSLLTGLKLLQQEQAPTLYVCPDATLLPVEKNGALMQAMLLQATNMGTAVCIFDLIGGRNPDPVKFMDDIATFRNQTGSVGLSHGTAYYPFVVTNVVQQDELNYTHLFGGDIQQLASILTPPDHPDPTVAAILSSIQLDANQQITQNNSALLNASKRYQQIIQQVLAEANILPPSGGMAGVMAYTDASLGVWHAPANVSIQGVNALTFYLSETQQGSLNIDPVSGKSINALRAFAGMGILVWGARTLDGNSQDWRYLNVRRTAIFIEQSCNIALRAFVFQPNAPNTWRAVIALVGNFLNSLWTEGGLLGVSEEEAFSVQCGLGATMTEEDIQLGVMNVTVMVAITHPAEYIVFTFQQQMAKSV